MTSGLKTIIYPVNDLAQAKTLYSKLLGVAPTNDSPYYVGFRVGDLDVGLDPNGHKHGMTPYWNVDNIQESLKELIDGGAEVAQAVSDVGGGRLIAAVKDPDGNVIGLLQDT
jgi:predicted enzyme related to lactoylglutathione lyase